MLRPAHQVTGYDVTSPLPYPHKKISQCDAAIIAVGTPQGSFGGADLTGLRAALKELPAHVPVLIRSTVPPGTTDAVNAAGRVAAHWPEYMHERPGGAWPESLDVPFAVVGGPPESLAVLVPVVAEIRAGADGPVHKCPAVVAELAKYAANIYGAAQLTLVNELAAVAAAHGADWEAVREAWTADPRVAAEYTVMKGFPPGFGGACMPKDLAALISSSFDHGYRPRFLEDIHAANARFRAARDEQS
jgi:nucleotide sugar dehydrogenase